LVCAPEVNLSVCNFIVYTKQAELAPRSGSGNNGTIEGLHGEFKLYLHIAYDGFIIYTFYGHGLD
jgi:hypothetical protein